MRVLDLDQRIGQGNLPLEDRQTDAAGGRAAGGRAAGDAGRVRPRDDAGRLARRAEDAAQLRLEPDAPDAAALGAQLLGKRSWSRSIAQATLSRRSEVAPAMRNSA